jgi:hypothetical protein
MKRALWSPTAVTFIVAAIYLGAVLWLAAGDPLEFARIGTRFSEGNPAGTEGYDGQFVLYIAQNTNPQEVAAQLDMPAYRYQRILLPLLGRTMALGNQELIPYVLPLIGLAAHISAVWLLSRILQGWGVSRWYALVYGLYVGMLLSLRLDLPEPLAFACVIAGFWFEQQKRQWLAWLFFGLASFSKETTILFVLAQLAVYVSARRGKDAIGLSLVALLPFAIFQVWLREQFGALSLSANPEGGIELIPFNGLWQVGEYSREYMWVLFLVYLPAFFLPALLGLWATVKRWLAGEREWPTAALFCNAVVFPFLPFLVYREPGGTVRFASGLVLAVLLYAARYRSSRALKYSWLWMVLLVFLFGSF